MARVEVHADLRARGLAEAQRRLRVVDEEARMRLECDLRQSRLPCERSFVAPVRNRHLVPLPFECLAVIRRPGARHPVRSTSIRTVAGTTGEAVDDVDAELDGETRGLAPRLVRLARERLVRVKRVAVAAEGADLQAALFDRIEQRTTLARVGEQRIGIAVGTARIVAGAELDGIEPECHDAVEHRLERKLREEHREDAELHREMEPRTLRRSAAPSRATFPNWSS